MPKPLDIFASQSPSQPDAIDRALAAEFAACQNFYRVASATMASLSAHSAAVGQSAIDARANQTPEGRATIGAIKTIIAAITTQWPAVSSYDLPTIHDEPVPVEEPAEGEV